MKFKFAPVALALLICASFSNECAAQSNPPTLPNPILYLIGQEAYSANGTNFVRYRYGIFNSSAYPDAMFAAAPTLPPCGTNSNSSRTWVDLFDQRGKRLYGFCALRKSEGLNAISFALPEAVVPPCWIYIELNDRQTATKYKSNLAETTN